MKRQTLFWGTLLILVGGVLLLDNLGVFSQLGFSAWQLIWPLALIYAGIWTVFWGVMRGRLGGVEEESLSAPLEDAARARIAVKYGAGECYLSGGAPAGLLFQGTFEGGLKHALTRHPDGTVNLQLSSDVDVIGPWNFGGGYRRRWDVQFSDALPVTLDLDTGASNLRADLSTMQVSAIDLDVGASSSEITLPARAGRTVVRGSVGAASLSLRVPEGVAARIHISGGLSSVQVDTHRFPRVDGGYESPDYESAEHRVDIRLDVGVGSVSVG